MGLSSLTQESLTVLLLFDKDNGGRVVSLVPVEVWDGVYQRVARKVYDYWASYKEPPGEHAVDMFSELELEDPKQKDQVRRLWESVQETREGINAKYVLGQVSTFLREQRIRKGIIESVELLESGKLAEAEPVFRESLAMGGKLLGDGHPNVAIWRSNLAQLLAEEGKLREAADLCSEGLITQRPIA